MAILWIMASSKIKSTYALDVETVRELEDIARRWNVSKSEALRRAIHAAAELDVPDEDALEALDCLQESMQLTEDESAAWTKRARRERTAAGGRVS